MFNNSNWNGEGSFGPNLPFFPSDKEKSSRKFAKKIKELGKKGLGRKDLARARSYGTYYHGRNAGVHILPPSFKSPMEIFLEKENNGLWESPEEKSYYLLHTKLFCAAARIKLGEKFPEIQETISREIK